MACRVDVFFVINFYLIMSGGGMSLQSREDDARTAAEGLVGQWRAAPCISHKRILHEFGAPI